MLLNVLLFLFLLLLSCDIMSSVVLYAVNMELWFSTAEPLPLNNIIIIISSTNFITTQVLNKTLGPLCGYGGISFFLDSMTYIQLNNLEFFSCLSIKKEVSYWASPNAQSMSFTFPHKSHISCNIQTHRLTENLVPVKLILQHLLKEWLAMRGNNRDAVLAWTS